MPLFPGAKKALKNHRLKAIIQPPTDIYSSVRMLVGWKGASRFLGMVPLLLLRLPLDRPHFFSPHLPCGGSGAGQTSVGVSTSVSVTTRAVVVIVAMGGNRSACRVVNGGSSARFLPPPSVKKGTRTPPYVRGARVETSARARCVDGNLNARKVLGENSIALRVGVCHRKTNGAGC